MDLNQLKVTLSLTIDGTAHAVPTTQVKRMDLDLRSYGFEAEVEFRSSPHRGEDSLFTPFTGAGLIEVSLSVLNAREESSWTLALKGLVTNKGWSEETAQALVTGDPVMHRTYAIRFADPARVLWGQHFPSELHVDTPLKTVIDAQKGAKITITYDWAAQMDASRPHVFLPLGGGEASFHDFLCWFVDTRKGVLTYDAATNAYKVSGAKAAAGTAVSLVPSELDEVRVELPETHRASAVVLNSSIAIAAKKEATANANGVAGVRRDFLVRHPVQADVDARATLEGSRLAARGHELVVRFALYPTVSVRPGDVVDFSHTAFGTAGFTSGKTYRVRELRLLARNADSEPTAEASVSWAFETEVSLRLEETSDVYAALPPFRVPRWPARVEGKIVSEQGAEADLTWQAYADSATSLDRYQVKVPLYENKLVYAPFDPNGMPGHLYFPAYKGATVLLAFQLFTVLIEKFLDWRPGGRLPVDGQGNHILVGKTETNRTSISHVYTDQKPVLLVSRLNDKDTQTIELKEGTLTIRTKEEA